jgi:hypothetical protein
MNLPDYKDIPPDEFAASEMKMTASFGDLTKRCECGCGWLKLGVHIEGKWGEIGALGQAIFWGTVLIAMRKEALKHASEFAPPDRELFLGIINSMLLESRT